MLAVGACSSGNDDGLTAERDDALAALTAAKTAAAAAATAAEEAQAAALAAAALAAEAERVTALADAKTAADAKLMAANNGLVTALQELDLEPASDTMSVEDQIAANTATLKAELASITDERDTALAALFAAGVEKAILEANAAMQTYARLLVTYEGIDANADTARGLVTAANRAKAEADEALAEAQAGDDIVLTERAQRAVRQADAAVLTANGSTGGSRDDGGRHALRNGDNDAGRWTSRSRCQCKRTGNVVTVTVRGGDPDTTVIAKGSASDAGHGWYKADVANEEDSTETATVYTNIENTMMKFNAVHHGDRDYVSPNTENGGLTLVNQDQFAPLNTYVSASNFPGPDPTQSSRTRTYDGSPALPTKFPGMFDGVPGQYECTGADDCTVTVDAKGEFTAITGVWTFIPAYFGEDGESLEGDTNDQVATKEDDLSVPSVAVPDTDYLHFGWWTQVEKDGDVAFRTFSGGLEPISTNNTDLEGSATYKGPAAGRYAVKTFNSNSTLESIHHGEFSAAAELKANFGGNAIAVNDQNRISGKVTNFVGQNGPC